MYVVFLSTIAKLQGVAVDISGAVLMLSACQHGVGMVHLADFIGQLYVGTSLFETFYGDWKNCVYVSPNSRCGVYVCIQIDTQVMSAYVCIAWPYLCMDEWRSYMYAARCMYRPLILCLWVYVRCVCEGMSVYV